MLQSVHTPCTYLSHSQVNVAMVMKQMKENSKKAIELLLATIPLIAQQDWKATIATNKVCYTLSDVFRVSYSTGNSEDISTVDVGLCYIIKFCNF